MPLESRAVEGSPRFPLKLECLLGRGAAGEVWKARSPFGFVAVKCIDLAQRSKDSELATQEAWLLQRIRHPHIVRFLDLVVDKGQMRIVMQLMEGDLAQAITRRREMSLDGFPEDQLWRWLRHLSSALAFLHRVKILHRDVKPANIFLSKSSDAILGDFSIAKVLSGALAATQIGTPGYLAPEVWLGHRYGPRSDVFSLGCSIFEAAELQRAFSAMAAEVCWPCPLRRSAAALSDVLRNLLRRMLEKTPRKRPGALEVLARVKAARSSSQDASRPSQASRQGLTPRDGNVAARSPSFGRSPGGFKQRHEKKAAQDSTSARGWGNICPWKDRVEVSSFYGLQGEEEQEEDGDTLSLIDTLVFSSSEEETQDLPLMEIPVGRAVPTDRPLDLM